MVSCIWTTFEFAAALASFDMMMNDVTRPQFPSMMFWVANLVNSS